MVAGVGWLGALDRWLFGLAGHSSAQAVIAQTLREARCERALHFAVDEGRGCGCASGVLGDVNRRMSVVASHLVAIFRRHEWALPPSDVATTSSYRRHEQVFHRYRLF